MPNSQNRISAQFSAADQDKFLKGLADLQKLLPFAQSLTAEERADLHRVGDRNLAFIRKAAEAVSAHAAALPRNFDEVEFRKDAELVHAMYPVVMALRQLVNSVEDTYHLAASEAYTGALCVYRSLRDNDQDGGIEATLDDLSARFTRRASRKPAPPAPSPAPPAP